MSIFKNKNKKKQQLLWQCVSVACCTTMPMKENRIASAQTGANDLQTLADRLAQQSICASLSRRFPKVTIIGEEVSVFDAKQPIRFCFFSCFLWCKRRVKACWWRAPLSTLGPTSWGDRWRSHWKQPIRGNPPDVVSGRVQRGERGGGKPLVDSKPILKVIKVDWL